MIFLELFEHFSRQWSACKQIFVLFVNSGGVQFINDPQAKNRQLIIFSCRLIDDMRD